jgi:cytoskeletal protein RodZ
MSSREGDRRRPSSDLSPLTLGLASVGSAVAALLIGRFGLAGTVVGAALTPVVITLVRELGKRPVERVVHLPSGRSALAELRPRIRWRLVAATSAAAFAVAVAALTLPELLRGESVVADRPTTFFSTNRGEGGGPAEEAPPAAPERTPPEDPSAPPPTETEPPPTTTAPPATEPAPVPEPPAEQPPPDPAEPAPAPAPPGEPAPAPQG